jgi:hypothetical protein
MKLKILFEGPIEFKYFILGWIVQFSKDKYGLQPSDLQLTWIEHPSIEFLFEFQSVPEEIQPEFRWAIIEIFDAAHNLAEDILAVDAPPEIVEPVNVCCTN